MKRLLTVLAAGGMVWTAAALAQNTAKKPDPAAVDRGKAIFQQKCSVCHYDTSEAKKIGPGLKGINKRGTFSVGEHSKVTDETLKTWIENGDSLMPPMKDVLDENQIKDVVAYVRTL